MRNGWALSGAATAGLALFCAGCGGVWVEREVMPPFDHTFIKKIAVVEFENLSTNKAAGKIVADRIEELLVNESPYEVVNRMELGQILKEHNLSVEMLLHPETMKKLGRIAGVEALVLGTVDAYDVEAPSDQRWFRVANVHATLKLVSTTSGRVLWSRKSRGRYDSMDVHRDRKGPGIMSEQDYLADALDLAAAAARSLFPHKEKVKVRADEVEEPPE